MSLRDWFWIVLLGAIWGCSFVFNAILIRELGPLWVTSLRVGIGALGCWAVMLALRKPVPRDPILWLQLAGLGVLAYAIPFALFPLAQAHLASGIAAIINALTPMVTAVISHFWIGGEKATTTKFTGVGIGFVGAAILVSPALSHGGTTQLWAVAACLGATLCYALTLNITRSFKHIEPTAFASIAPTGAAVVAIPVAFFNEGAPVMTRPETWGAALAIGLLSTAFTFHPPPGWEPYTDGLDVAAVTPEQYGLVRSFLLRANDLSPGARYQLALDLANPLSGVLHHQPPPGVQPEAFLRCLAAAYQRRQSQVAPPPLQETPF